MLKRGWPRTARFMGKDWMSDRGRSQAGGWLGDQADDCAQACSDPWRHGSKICIRRVCQIRNVAGIDRMRRCLMILLAPLGEASGQRHKPARRRSEDVSSTGPGPSGGQLVDVTKMRQRRGSLARLSATHQQHIDLRALVDGQQSRKFGGSRRCGFKRSLGSNPQQVDGLGSMRCSVCAWTARARGRAQEAHVLERECAVEFTIVSCRRRAPVYMTLVSVLDKRFWRPHRSALTMRFAVSMSWH